MTQYIIKGNYSYREQQNLPYVGFLRVDEEQVKGTILDEAADRRDLFFEGILKHKNGEIVLEFKRRAFESRFPQNTLSDPMVFTLSKKDDGSVIGAYEGTYKFAEKCLNMSVGLDEHGEKAPFFQDDTATTGKANLTLEEIL